MAYNPSSPYNMDRLANQMNHIWPRFDESITNGFESQFFGDHQQPLQRPMPSPIAAAQSSTIFRYSPSTTPPPSSSMAPVFNFSTPSSMVPLQSSMSYPMYNNGNGSGSSDQLRRFGSDQSFDIWRMPSAMSSSMSPSGGNSVLSVGGRSNSGPTPSPIGGQSFYVDPSSSSSPPTMVPPASPIRLFAPINIDQLPRPIRPPTASRPIYIGFNQPNVIGGSTAIRHPAPIGMTAPSSNVALYPVSTTYIAIPYGAASNVAAIGSEIASMVNKRRGSISPETIGDQKRVYVPPSERRRFSYPPRQPEYCAFCKRNGESREFYSAHRVRDQLGRVTCPVLYVFKCPSCGATGDSAHTASYCPNRPAEQGKSFSRLQLYRTSTGKVRGGTPEDE